MAKKGLGDIVDQVISTSWEILDYRAKIAMGKYDQLPENYIDFNEKEQQKIIELVKPLLSTQALTKKINAETSKDIIKLISKGKISLTEAKELMQLTGARLEVEEKEMKVAMTKKMMTMLDEE